MRSFIFTVYVQEESSSRDSYFKSFLKYIGRTNRTIRTRHVARAQVVLFNKLNGAANIDDSLTSLFWSLLFPGYLCNGDTLQFARLKFNSLFTISIQRLLSYHFIYHHLYYYYFFINHDCCSHYFCYFFFYLSSLLSIAAHCLYLLKKNFFSFWLILFAWEQESVELSRGE